MECDRDELDKLQKAMAHLCSSTVYMPVRCLMPAGHAGECDFPTSLEVQVLADVLERHDRMLVALEQAMAELERLEKERRGQGR